MDELAGIRMFVRVVEGGSFVAAARGLGLSKSVITKRVRELEDRLNAQLLVRSTRRLTLTDAGASYFERCVRIVAELDEAQSAVRSLTVGLTGTLRISCIASFLAHQLARDVCRFQQQHPDLVVELHHNDRIYDPIQEGYDVCIQPADVGGEGIVRQEVVPLRRLLVATPGYFERHGQPSHPNQLIAHRCAHNNYILPLADITFTGPDGPVRIPPIRPIVLSNSIWMIREAALSGDCVAILPIYAIVDELRSGALLPVFEDFRVGAAMLCAFYRRSPRLPAKVRMLLGFLAEQYDDEPPWEQKLFRDRPQLRRVVYGPQQGAKNISEEAKSNLRGVTP
jgi:DNA-binding transcriptional LysR family regulator